MYAGGFQLTCLAAKEGQFTRPTIIIIDSPCQQHLQLVPCVSPHITVGYGTDTQFIIADRLVGAIPTSYVALLVAFTNLFMASTQGPVTV